MNPLSECWNHPVTARVGWTLLHFLWQGALLAGAYAAVRAGWLRRAAQARYLAGCATLLLMAVMPVLTYQRLSSGPPATSPPEAATLSIAAHQASAASGTTARAHLVTARQLSPGWSEALGARVEAALPWLVAGWVLGVVMLSGRLAVGWTRLRRVRRRSGESLDARLGARVRELQLRLGLSWPVRLLQSALVEVPTLIGWFRPVILLPASTLTGLTPAQLDLILAHELAHLRRRDHWVNLFQILLETLLFYHPAVWWVSRCVREDRELCCDELAVAVCGDRLAYARALLTLEELRGASAAMTLSASGGSLLERIRRILRLPEEADGGGRLGAAGNALLLVGMLMLAAGAALYASAPRGYAGVTRVLVETAPPTAWDLLGRGASRGFDPHLLYTEIERITSRPVLEAAARTLNLAERWGLRGPGEAGNEVETVRRLRQRLNVRQVRLTGILEITALAPDPAEAAELANAVAEAYRLHHASDTRDTLKREVQVLEAELLRQSNRVNELRQRLDDRAAQGTFTARAGAAGRTDASFERRRQETLAEQLSQLETEYETLLWQANYLKRVKDKHKGNIHQIIPTFLPQEPELPTLVRELNSAEQTLAKLRVDRGENHPEVRAAEAVLDQIKRQIEDRVAEVIQGLDMRAELLNHRRMSLQGNLREIQARQVEEAEAQKRYRALQSELDKEERVLDALYLRMIQTQVDAKAAGSHRSVTILEAAAPDSRQRRRSGHPADLALMAAGALTSAGGLILRKAG